MARILNSQMLDAKTPNDVNVQPEARQPITDPTLGIPVTVNRVGTPKHRLVTIGDSLTHGFKSGAIFQTQLSYPSLIARELGWREFRYPSYNGPGEGLPLNLEAIARRLEQRFGASLEAWEFPSLLWFLRNFLEEQEDYWERGAGSQMSQSGKIYHNLAVYGWDLRNTLSRNADIIQAILTAKPAKDNVLPTVVENHNDRAALRVLNSARDHLDNALTPLQAARQLSLEATPETHEGIETLIVFIGANNALGSILRFEVIWSDADYEDMTKNDLYTVWRPNHFQAELDKVVAEVAKINAHHVIWATVPHVTIAPFARGVETKVAPGSRYFPYYTLPWLSDRDFNPKKHPYLTSQEARAIDSAIDQYNESITNAVRQARNQGKDWYLLDIAGILDRLASKRYIEDPQARPDWWTPYELPTELQALSHIPNSKYFISDKTGILQGGLFSLDGIHPTTIGYGIIAQEFIQVMELAGVKFYEPDGKTERESKIRINFKQLIAEDTLISNPPDLLAEIIQFIGRVDRDFNIFGGLMTASY